MSSPGSSINALLKLHEDRDKLYLGALDVKTQIDALGRSGALDSLASLGVAAEKVGNASALLTSLDVHKLGALVVDLPSMVDVRSLLLSPVATNLLTELDGLRGVHLTGTKALMEQAALASTISRGLETVDLAGIGSCVEFFERDFGLIGPQLAALKTDVLTAGQLLGQVNVATGFADLLPLTDITRSLLRQQTNRLGVATRSLGRDVEKAPDWFLDAPEFVRAEPGRAVVAQVRFIHAVSTPDDTKGEIVVHHAHSAAHAEVDDMLACISEILPQLDPKLVKPWNGAWHARQNAGPDATRHVTVSLRVVLIGVLDAVAPATIVENEGDKKHLDPQGKSTRRAQVEWICSSVKSPNFAKVLRRDLEAAMGIIDASQEGVHRLECGEIEVSIGPMIVRSMVPLTCLLQLWQARR